MTASSVLSYSCLETTQGGKKLYTFFASAREIFQFASINQKMEDADGGYQRAASPARTRSITRFVESGNMLPLSILITLEKDAAKLSNGKIEIKKQKSSAWVIDGQHRLAGAKDANVDIILPVVAFIGLDEEEQIQQFITINKEAKGVPTSLYYSLMKRLPPRHSAADNAKERSSDIGILLRNSEQSPFSAKIVVTTAPKQGQLSLVNFVRKIAPLVKEDTGILGQYSVEEQVKIIDNYYTAARNVFNSAFGLADSSFFSTVGFGAMFNFFPTFFSYTLKEFKTFTVEDATKSLSIISHVDPVQWKKSGTGNAVEVAIGKDLAEELRALTQQPGDAQSTIAL